MFLVRIDTHALTWFQDTVGKNETWVALVNIYKYAAGYILRLVADVGYLYVLIRLRSRYLTIETDMGDINILDNYRLPCVTVSRR
jgi:hypothetical protein